MLTDQQRQAAAEALMRADATRTPIPQLSKTYPDMTLEDAYAVQGLWRQALIDKGDRRAGTKIGLTSRAMQMASRFNEPDYGFLMHSMLYNDGAAIPAGRFSAPRLEVELAFVMGEDLEGPTARVYDVMRAVEFVIPAMEIIDYRTETPRQIVDTIADNAAAAAMVVGGRPIRPFDMDIRWIDAMIPFLTAGIAWLVNKLHPLGGKLSKGEIVLAGAFTRPVSVAPGDVIQADFGPLGAIGVSFV